MKEGPLEYDGRTIEISSVDKVFFPDAGITKGDVLDHYRSVAPVMAPHLAGRPLTLQRFPDGIEGSGFYQKDASGHFPDWIRTVEVEKRSGQGTVDHVVCDDEATLMYLADQGTVTFHVGPAPADDLERPDIVVFDLDPPEDRRLDDLRAGVRIVWDGLEEVGLTPFLQTTGSKGFHVVAPIEHGPSFDQVRRDLRDLAHVLVEREPDLLTTAQRKDKREGRIYLDLGRNAFGQTYVAPYSVRPREGAPVATPIDRDELGRTEPRSYAVGNIRRRLGQKDDPWAGMHRQAVGWDDVAAAIEEHRTSGGV